MQRLSAPDAHPEEVEDDHDYPPPLKHENGSTIGEELFKVHLRRSEGLEPDVDDDGSLSKGEGNIKPSEHSPSDPEGNTIHLRNRDIPH